MKFSSFTSKKDNTPKLSSLRPPLFRIDFFWFMALGLSAVVLIISGVIGFNLFYRVYFESYKQNVPEDTFGDPINSGRLKSAIERRSAFINAEISLPSDPSL